MKGESDPTTVENWKTAASEKKKHEADQNKKREIKRASQ